MLTFSKLFRKYFFFTGLFSLFYHILFLALPIYVLVIYERVLFSSSNPSLLTLSLGAGFAFLTLGLFHFLRMRLVLQAGLVLEEKITSKLLENMHLEAFRSNGSGYTQGLKDLKTLRSFFASSGPVPFFDLLGIPIYIALLYFMHIVLACLALAGLFVLACLAFLQHRLMDKRLKIAELADAQGEGFLKTSLGKVELVQGLGMLKGVQQRIRDLQTRAAALEAESARFHGSVLSVVRTVRIVLLAGIYGTGTYLFFLEQISAGLLIASVIVLWQVLSPVEEAFSAWEKMVLSRSALKRIQNCLQARLDKETMQLPAPEGRLDLEGAGLALAGRYVLRNIAFSLQKGEHLGVIGPSASGKSALCRLILGYWPSMAGKVRLDGADIQQWEREDLGKYIGYLPQEIELFPGTVSENIARLGEVDPDKVVQAAQRAGAHQTILHLPQGYDTVLDQTGKNLSAGQRQRIALARALYSEPAFVVMDCPETGLDEEGERAILACLAEMKKSGVTVVLSTHKPRLLNTADKLILLKDGQVSMLGPRQEVLNKLMGQQKQAQSGSS